jgi:nucleoid DNA-binding protein
MNLADHLRPLLRDHDCVIIPDFGGLVAEYTPARVQPGGRHVLSPPTRQVAFNQALTRNDGLLVDALRQHLNVPAAEAREALRQAVATLHRDLQTQQRTELPGIGVFRQLAGRGLQFEYTGTDNLLTAAFGLPELTVHPVSVTDARLAREQQAQLVPRLRSAGRGVKLRRVMPATAIGLLAGLAVAGLYLLNLHPAVLPTAWQSHLPRWEQAPRQAAPQQAALA